MRRLANHRSNDSISSSKISRNVGNSPLGREGHTHHGDKGSALMQDHSLFTTSKSVIQTKPHKEPHNLSGDLDQFYDTSDSDDCESVGSNSSTLNLVKETYINNDKSIGIDKCRLNPQIHHNSLSMKENLANIGGGTENHKRVCEKKFRHGRNEDHESNVPIPNENYLNVGNPHKSCRGACKNTHLVRSKDGSLVNNSHGHSPNPLSKTIPQISNINHSITKDAVTKDNPIVQNANNSNSCKTIEKPNYTIDFDEGDGGGTYADKTTNHPYVNNYNNSNHNKSHGIPSQDINQESKLESFDERDGGGFNPHPTTRRRRHVRHGRQSRRASSSKSSRSSRRRRKASPHSSSSGSSKSRSRGSSHSSNSGSSKSKRSRRKARSRKGSRHNSSGTNSCKGFHTDGTLVDGMLSLSGTKPYPSNWRCFGRRPPAIHEFRPLGDLRLENVRPAGKVRYLMRDADKKPGCVGIDATDAWDNCYGLAKPITDQWSNPLPYGTQVVRAGDIDPYFHPSRGDIVIINPAQDYYRAMKSGYVMTLRGQDYTFGVGDLVIHLGRFMPTGEYIPYGNLELYMHTQTMEMRLLGRQPFLLVDFNYHNLDYESPGKYLAVGTFLNESFFPRRGDIIIRGGAWAENYPNVQRKHHSSVKYWRPRMEFLPNDMLLRPYVDIGRKVRHQSGRKKFYWGAAELYSYSGKGLAWAYWGRDHHICDTPFPREQEHGIKTGHHKGEVGHYGDYGVGFSHGHRGDDDCHSQHNLSSKHKTHRQHGHQAEDDCHREHELSLHPRR